VAKPGSGGRWARPAESPPMAVWVLTVLMAVISFAGAFVFAFPLQDALGNLVGVVLIASAAAYVCLAWFLRQGHVNAWRVGLVVPVVHQGTLIVEFLIRYGEVPAQDVPFLSVGAAMLLLLLLPRTRRFFAPSTSDAQPNTSVPQPSAER
jgi:hypothetical protein